MLIFHAVFQGKSSRARYLNPLIQFCRQNFDHTTWASFNWDCIFGSSFYYSSGDPLPHGERRRNPSLEVDLQGWRYQTRSHLLLKLHGSINWWMIDGELRYVSWGRRGKLRKTWREYDQADDPDDLPVILEPSFYKYDTEDEDEKFLLEQLRPQWSQFLERLLNADYVIIVGYSLPPADALARSTILNGFQVNSGANWLVVDQGESTCRHYRRLLGRLRLQCLEMTLAGFSQNINAHLSEGFPGLEFEPVDIPGG